MMVKIPEKQNTTENAIESMTFTNNHRSYLGMSGIGHECILYLWYSFHWAYKPEVNTARQKRIFDRGDLEEQRIIKDLKSIGIEVFRRDRDGSKIEIYGFANEKQEEMVVFGGHIKGHIDGRALGVKEAPKTEHLLEFKTANESNFKKIKNLGVALAKPEYYAQMQRYMHELKLTRTLFIVTNKNTEERYYERVRYDKDHALMLVEKEQEVIVSICPPKDKFSPTWYKCRWCNAKDICHTGKEPEKNCRTCQHVDFYENGRWSCCIDNNNPKTLSLQDQRNGCDKHKFIDGL